MNSIDRAVVRVTLLVVMSLSLLYAQNLQTESIDSQPIAPFHAGQIEIKAVLSWLVGPGDAIRLRVYPDTSSFISGTYVVLDNETIFLPVLGQMAIGSMTMQQLGDLLNEKYHQFLRYSVIQIEPLIRVSLLGGFIKPGLYYVNPMHSLWNTVSTAGGTLREDGMDLLRWERDGKLESKKIGKDSVESKSLFVLGIKSGDCILVTTQPKFTPIDRFTNTIIPVLSFLASTLLASATLYIAYHSYTGTHP